MLYILKNNFIFEMIYQKGINEECRLLYWEDSKFNRISFLELMHLEVDKEFNKFKDTVNSLDKDDLLDLLNEVCLESHKHLNLMSINFIENGEAYYDESIFLKVIKRNVTK